MEIHKRPVQHPGWEVRPNKSGHLRTQILGHSHPHVCHETSARSAGRPQVNPGHPVSFTCSAPRHPLCLPQWGWEGGVGPLQHCAHACQMDRLLSTVHTFAKWSAKPAQAHPAQNIRLRGSKGLTTSEIVVSTPAHARPPSTCQLVSKRPLTHDLRRGFTEAKTKSRGRP